MPIGTERVSNLADHTGHTEHTEYGIRERVTLTFSREALFALVDTWNSSRVTKTVNGFNWVVRLAVRDNGDGTVDLEETIYSAPPSF